MRTFIAVTAWLTTTVAASAADQPIDVFLVAGQSNAVGADAPPSQMPNDAIDDSILFRWRCGDPPPDEHDSISNGWQKLRAQPLGDPITPRRDRQYGNFAQPDGGFGPEIGFARAIALQQSTPIAVVKVAFSGTHIAGDWNPNAKATDAATEHDSRGACYRELVQQSRRAIADLKDQHYDPTLVAMVWVQGESDATAQRVDDYQHNLGRMIQTLRSDLKAPELIALLGVNTRFGGGKNQYMPAIIAAQQAYGQSDPLACYVDTAGATIANHAHYDAAGTIDVGQRFAKALKAMRSVAAE
ncbi:MAG: hypothetical protein HKN47_25875 [Pirellulaceae bacterium]|nr:hypothetical protein [Pirellulaceae bacterium]